jgi:hypothetical protein
MTFDVYNGLRVSWVVCILLLRMKVNQGLYAMWFPMAGKMLYAYSLLSSLPSHSMLFCLILSCPVLPSYLSQSRHDPFKTSHSLLSILDVHPTCFLAWISGKL